MIQRIIANVVWECDRCEVIFSSTSVALDNAVIKVGNDFSDIFLSSRMKDTVKDCPVCGGAQNPRIAECKIFDEDEEEDNNKISDDEWEEMFEMLMNPRSYPRCAACPCPPLPTSDTVVDRQQAYC